MKKIILLLVAVSLLGTITACSTFDSRVKEKPAAFAGLSPTDQEDIRNGFIKVGFTPEMVYMALAKPERKISGAAAGEETWIYNRVIFADGGSPEAPRKLMANSAGADGVVKLRVKFENGKVRAVEVS